MNSLRMVKFIIRRRHMYLNEIGRVVIKSEIYAGQFTREIYSNILV